MIINLFKSSNSIIVMSKKRILEVPPYHILPLFQVVSNDFVQRKTISCPMNSNLFLNINYLILQRHPRICLIVGFH